MAIFGPEPCVNPFRKMSIFRLFEFLVLMAQKGVFSFENIVKKHFPGLYCLKRTVVKLAIVGLEPWVNPFGKISIFRPFELVFLAQVVFLVLECSQTHFSVLYCLKIKVGKMAIFTTFFQAIQAKKMSFTIFSNEKTTFQAIKTRNSKS